MSAIAAVSDDAVVVPRDRGSRPPWISAGIITVVVFAALVGPLLTGYDHTQVFLRDRLLAPGSTLADGSTAWFGTDNVGRDILGQVLAGARVSLGIGLATVIVSLVVGVVVGVLAGYAGGVVDAIIMRVVDVLLALPSIVVAIVIAGALGPSVTNLIIAMAATRWVAFARLARGSTLSLREREYVEASRLLGHGPAHTIRVHIMPFLRDQLVVVTTIEFGMVVLQQSALGFLGIGLPTDIPSWGVTIAGGRSVLDSAWWVAAIPGLALALLVTAAGFLGDGIRAGESEG